VELLEFEWSLVGLKVLVETQVVEVLQTLCYATAKTKISSR
jgi:hypothetical protein